MKLQNKETGEIGTPRVDYQEFYVDTENGYTYCYKSLQRMYEEWEDAPEEPKGFWLINILGIVEYTHGLPEHEVEMLKKIGNYFETEEQAIKARDKLFAWQRIEEDLVSLHWQDEKDGKFSVWGQFYGNMLENDAILNIHRKDLDLLFGSEE